MAIRTISNAGGNWNAAGTWVGGVIPTAADDVVATATSGNLTINVTTAVCLSLNLTNYVGTLTYNAGQILTVSGNVTYVAGMTVAGTGTLTINAVSTINSNGITHTGNLTLTGTTTITLANNLTISGNLGVNTATVLNGATQILYVGGNFILSGVGNLTGNISEIVMNGTGNLQASANIQVNLTINTTGTITFSNLVRYGTGTFKHIAGNVFANNNFETRAACTLDLSGIWLSGVVAYASFTLLSDFNVGNYTTQSNVVATGFSVRITGNIAFGGGLVQSGTSDFVICGSGKQFWYTASGTLRNNLIIDCTGSFIITRFQSTGLLPTNTAFGNIYGTGTITYVRGRVDASDCSLRLGTCTLKGLNKATTFKEVIINTTAVITTDEFFSGSAKVPATISSSVPATNYTITFTDGFEKLARYVTIYSMTLTNTATNPGSLLVVTPGAKKFLNRVIGNVRSVNQLPNGFAKDGGQYIDPMTYPAAGLVSDPSFIVP